MPVANYLNDIQTIQMIKKSESPATSLLDVIIVGGGLSGLVLARFLNRSNLKSNNDEERRHKIKWKLFEASSRIGGRLQNDVTGDGRSRKIDLGGAWIWPRAQPVIMKSLVHSPTLGIKTFLQPGEDYAFSETTRIVGGAIELAKRIYDELVETDNQQRVETNRQVTAIRRNSDGTITVEFGSGENARASNVVLAVPPRILSKSISFNPNLSAEKSDAMTRSQTWMAGVTKVALVYNGAPPPFWHLIVREGGQLLSPRIRRPAFQVYDGSPYSSMSKPNYENEKEEYSEQISVLTFFTLASLSNRNNDDGMLAKDCAEQMCDSLSADAIREVPILSKYIRSYDDFCVKRWPLDSYISHDKNPTRITPHPEPVPELAKSEWNGTLLFAGTETDQHSPGVMEGAVRAAIRVAKDLAIKLPTLSLE